MFKTARFEDRAFKPLSIAVIAVSDTRTLETDTGGALLKSLLEADGHSARVMAKDHGFAVPMDSAGEAHAWGVLQVEPISAEHARHLVEDDGAQAPAAQELRIVATGIEIIDGTQ